MDSLHLAGIDAAAVMKTSSSCSDERASRLCEPLRENGYVDSFNGKLRGALLDGEIFYTLKEAQIAMAGWRGVDNGPRPSLLG